MAETLRCLQLSILPGEFTVVRLASDAPIPDWAAQGFFFSITRTVDELSIVAEESRVPSGLESQSGWRMLKVRGPLPLSEVGVMASLASPLARARISLFVVSTFDTDYLLVASESLAVAVSVLEQSGHTIHRS